MVDSQISAIFYVNFYGFRVSKPPMMMTDRELIEDFLRGNEQSFNDLIRKHQAWVVNFVMQTISIKEDAEDIAQDVFVKVYFALPKFRFESEFKTWLYRIVINRMNNFFRKQKLLNWFGAEMPAEPVDAPSENNDDHRRELTAMVNRLPRVQRNVTILRSFQQMSFRQVAAVLNITENSAKVSFHKAKNNLKRMTDGQHVSR